MYTIHIKKESADVRTPKKAHSDDAAYDIYAYMPIKGFVVIAPHQTVRIATGLQMCPAKGYFISFRPRSGMAYKQNLIIANTPATIDENYSGECMILLHNQGNEIVTIQHDERCAQMVLDKRRDVDFIETQVLPNETSTRGANGFGSSGK